MWWSCVRCRYEVQAPAAPAACPACGRPGLGEGRQPTGFEVRGGVPVLRGITRPAYQPREVGTVPTHDQLNYFVGEVGSRYRKFIMTNTRYVGRFTTRKVPEPGRFAWLSPYTGNKHNRTHFTQMLLASVAQAKFRANGDRFPRLVEPFVGSGQVFLHAGAWGPALNDGLPLFHEVVAGDLNPYVIAAYEFLLTFGHQAASDYATASRDMDADLAASYSHTLRLLDSTGRDRLGDSTDPGRRHEAGVAYIWLVNRCLRGSTLNLAGGVSATLNPNINIAKVREREQQTLTAVLAGLRGVDFSYACRDFAATCALAQPTDVVFLDCPFPKFTYTPPDRALTDPVAYGAVAANTYGTGDDGPDLQRRIVAEARRLVEQGTTVVLCNFATPGLVLAYRALLGDSGVGEAEQAGFVYTYRSPTTDSEAYQVVVLPGAGVDFRALPARVNERWVRAGGDDLVTGQYFQTGGHLQHVDLGSDGMSDEESASNDSDSDSDYQP